MYNIKKYLPRRLSDLLLFFNQREHIRRLINEIDALKRHQNFHRLTKFKGINILLRMYEFSQQCEDLSAELESDTFVAHEVAPLLGMNLLANKFSAKKVCNVVEIPSYRHRAVPVSWNESVMLSTECISDDILAQCNELLTVGPTLAAQLAKYGTKITIVPNYKYRQHWQKNSELRLQCSVGEDDILLLAMSTISSGFEILLDSLKLLPERFHLAVVGTFAPKEYGENVIDYVCKAGLSNRVHILDPISYDKLSSYVSSADLGLIVRDSSILNNYVSLPNRVFDYIHANLPFVSPQIPDIEAIVRDDNIGEIIESETPQSWAESILQCIDNLELYKKNIAISAENRVWEVLEPTILDVFQSANSITFLGVSNLAKNNRTLRIAKTLLKNGKSVKIFGAGNEKDITLKNNNLKYFFTEKNYGK